MFDSFVDFKSGPSVISGPALHGACRVAFVLPSKVTSGLQSRRWKPPRPPLVVDEHPPTDLTSKSTVPHDVPRVFNHQNLVFMEFVSKMPSMEIHESLRSQAIWSHLQRHCHGTATQVHKWNKRSFRNCSCNKTPINNQCISLFFSICVWQRSSWLQKQ